MRKLCQSCEFTYPSSFIGVLNSAPDHFWKKGQSLIGFKDSDYNVLNKCLNICHLFVG